MSKAGTRRLPGNKEIEEMAAQMCASPKYRGLDLPQDMVISLLKAEFPNHRNTRDAIKAARQKLHQVVALYLEEPDYEKFSALLNVAFLRGGENMVEQVCLQILGSHASTRERLPIMDEFYGRIFEVTGKPNSILDLACGLQPFALPWMGLPAGTSYFAYDLNRPRVDLINLFFHGIGRKPLAQHGDILLHPPELKGDVAFFFKEAHRFEQRARGCNRQFWQALNVNYLLVSLPTSSLSGRHELLDQQRNLVYSNLEGLSWTVKELLFENEIVFCMEKNGQA